MEQVRTPTNRIQLVGHTIVVRLIGDQTKETMAPVKRAISRLVNEPESFKNILVDLSEVKHTDKGARQEAEQFLSELPGGKVALVTKRSPAAFARNWILKLRTKTKAKVKLCSGELFAREWLARRS